uniref:Receptor L-domain domain-containing protein n=1 Tax=Chromera velia CCMP2878 TaxID=1169474 RepID=A0A0G4F271_9ALVE|eukprot:Cvel_14671.t1-p1 / transcript=Cvel_14671.t1 / gene=Cvel_14671 / organism=Chromera_velia_CCMP2878 / gene_product=hypothetical protein / transcript_product=hypothetical protein / location=Cvel_scaffold1052:13231-15768(-) / protein_length=520 / sequence_SO=supercontig / SO=protein_coding / is_pseudo=false
MIGCLGVVGVLSSVALAVPLPELDVEKLRGEFGDLRKGLDLKGLGDLSGGLKVGEFGFDKLNLFDKKDKKKDPCDFTLPIPKEAECPPWPLTGCTNVFTGTFSTVGETVDDENPGSVSANGCNLSPLDGVCKIEGELVITDCRFTNLKELQSLREVTGGIRIEKLWSLESLNDLSALVTVGGQMIIREVPLVKEVAAPALCNLETVEGNLELGGTGIEFWPLELIHLPALKTVTGDFRADDFSKEMKAILLPVLETLGGNTEINENSGLELFYAPELRLIEGPTIFGDGITENCDLKVIFMPKLETALDLVITENKQLACIDLSSLKNATSEVEIRDQPELQELRIGSLETTGDSLDISDLGLTELNLPKLTTVGTNGRGNLELGGSFGLKTISAPLLTTVNGNLELDLLSSLETLNLDSLTLTNGNLIITFTQLTDLDTFSNLQGMIDTNTDRQLTIRQNAKMTSAEGLAGAVAVPVFSDGFICDNPLLADLPVSFGGLNEDPVVCDASEPPCDCSFTL